MHGTTPPNSRNNQSSPYQLPTDNCPICLAAFAGSQVRVTEPCNHMFHATCLTAWLSRETTCPYCRASLETRGVNQRSTGHSRVDQPPADGLCVMCCDIFSRREVSVINRCNHMFHRSCLLDWLLISTFCPLCHTSLEG
ncbi:RING finger domain-containing protein [Endozoicomonas sp. ONNA2]|uniref:RING finger domain-containing protein n=1 Tax=Endozoicomonas sp. ONNA2 TaxID=2828741 RepID=UPI0035A1A7E2